MKHAAVFIDRDGVINRDRKDYVKKWEEFEFLPGVLEALRMLSRKRLRLVIVTNQSCIGRGLVSRADVEAIHLRMIACIASAGGRVDGIYMCPHAPGEGCKCRKPSPGLLDRAIRDLRIDPLRSWMIGDRWRDIQAAYSVGLRSVLVGPSSPKRNLQLYRSLHATDLLSGARKIQRSQ